MESGKEKKIGRVGKGKNMERKEDEDDGNT